MKRVSHFILVMATASVAGGRSLSAEPMGTAFTYQGELMLGGSSVTSECTFEFSLWHAARIALRKDPCSTASSLPS